MTCRLSATTTVTIASGAAISSEPFDMRNYVSGVVHLPGGWTAADLGFKVAAEDSYTPQPLNGIDGAAVEVSSPTASNSYKLPDELFAARFVWFWSQSSGSDVNQAADRTVRVDLKS